MTYDLKDSWLCFVCLLSSRQAMVHCVCVRGPCRSGKLSSWRCNRMETWPNLAMVYHTVGFMMFGRALGIWFTSQVISGISTSPNPCFEMAYQVTWLYTSVAWSLSKLQLYLTTFLYVWVLCFVFWCFLPRHQNHSPLPSSSFELPLPPCPGSQFQNSSQGRVAVVLLRLDQLGMDQEALESRNWEQ